MTIFRASNPSSSARPWKDLSAGSQGRLQSSHSGEIGGHFVTTPWEGLRWEPCTLAASSCLPESELLEELDRFLSTLPHSK
jgi:hypothetical protein